MVALTLASGVALVLGLIGLAFLVNGLRHAFIDEVAIAAILFIIVWWLL